MTDTVSAQTDSAIPTWNDTSLDAGARADALIAAMTLPEKIAQLFGVWVGASDEGGEVAPHQHEMEEPADLDALLPDGLGQLTRPFGTAPVDPALGALSLLRTQRRIAGANRFGIPALAHEECLAGFAAWGATAYPVPLSWGASFNPGLVRTMAAAIGRDMRAVGVHQGLAPVLDVVRDARWGRVEECISEDPYLVGTVATSYVRGLQDEGVVATLKHFVGYSASRAGRNLAPVHAGPREVADVLLVPFEMAVLDGGARSVMHSYAEVGWLTPYPDPLLDEVRSTDDEPDVVAVSRETVELAFVAALQVLPPRQRAALLAREVLGLSAAETARLLGTSVAAANSALQRARETMGRHLPSHRADWRARPASAQEADLLAAFIDAHQRCDAEAALAVAATDLRITMPPLPLCFDGVDAVAPLLERAFGPEREGDWRLLPTSANRMPAAASYLRRHGDRVFRAFKLDVLRVEQGAIAEITTFGPDLFGALGLPPRL